MTDESPQASASLLPWWEEWGRRLDQELQRFADRGLPLTILEDPRSGASRLVVETEVELREDGPTRVIVAYPDGFPSRRFLVFAPDLNLPRHQAPNGNLCVFPRDARYWDPKYMAADVVADDVPRLVDLVRTGGETLRREEDPQGEPITAYYGGIPTGGIVVDDRVIALTPSTGDHGTLAISFANGDSRWLLPPPSPLPEGWVPLTGQGLLVQVRDASGTDLLSAPPPALSARFGQTLEGRWTFLPDPPLAASAGELWEAVCVTDPEIARYAGTPGGKIVGVCIREEVAQDTYEHAWFFLTLQVTETGPTRKQKRSGNPSINRARGVTSSPPQVVRGLRWTPDNMATRIPELQPLREATVSVIGLGSLGAPLVQELAKSRVGSLRLSDFDFIDAGTSVRYPLGLLYAGVDKGLALAQWVQAHNPEVDVRIVNVNIGAAFWDEQPTYRELDQITALLTDTNLMVGATAEPDVNRQLDLMAIRMKVPRLYLWSQSGYGGVVALLRTGETGCFHCLSLHIRRLGEAGNELVQVPPDVDGQPAGTVQGRGCADKTFTASHADLLPLSIQAARVAYGFLCGGTEGGYPAFQDDVFAVQVREADGTPIPPRWTSFKLPPDPACQICHPA